MPCSSDGYPTRDVEAERKEASRLVTYLVDYLNLPVEEKLGISRELLESGADASIRILCREIHNLQPEERERVLGNPDPESKKLRKWWKRHEEADRRREAFEKERRDREAAKKSGLSKLTKEERKALGLP